MALSNKAFLKNLLPTHEWQNFLDEVDNISAGILPAGSVSATELASTLDLSSKTVTLPAASVTASMLAATLDLSSNTITLGAITMAGAIALYPIGSAAASASGLLMGVGTSVAPATTSTADAKFVEIRAQTTATSGDNRLAYLRYDINGAGAGGECIRAFTDLTAAASTARGAHVSLQAGDTGYVSGLGAGFDAQLYVKDAALPAGGTYTPLNVEIYAEGTSSDVSAVTNLAVQRLSLGGDATGVATVEAKANFIELAGFTAGSGNIVDTDITALTGKAGLRVTIDGVLYGYIPIVTGA